MNCTVYTVSVNCCYVFSGNADREGENLIAGYTSIGESALRSVPACTLGFRHKRVATAVNTQRSYAESYVPGAINETIC